MTTPPLAWLTAAQARGAEVQMIPRPAQAPQWVPWPADLHPRTRAALEQADYARGYAHQVAVWQALQQHPAVLLAVPTATGKSLAYQVPTLDALHRDPAASALYIFPTKALAHDQQVKLQALGLRQTATYDGDTPRHRRAAIRRQARLVLTNPEMLHYSLLPRHPAWARFWRGLRLVVLDEAHVYRGVFGTHVAWVLRRLQRVAAFYGARPRFLLTTATVGNPASFGRALLGQEVQVLTQHTAERGPRVTVLYNPPLIDAALGLRRGALEEAVRLALAAWQHGLQTLIFVNSRRSVEHALRRLRQRAPRPEQVAGYRSGYLPAERRAVEQGLRSGQLRVVVSTSALELGVDLAGLDVVLVVGYPGTLAALRQRFGRAGRGPHPGVAVFLATMDPIDQYLVRHPAFTLQAAVEQALVAPGHERIASLHLACALAEGSWAVEQGFADLSPAATRRALQPWLQTGEAQERAGRWFWIAPRAPSSAFSLRSTDARRVALYTNEATGPRLIGEVEYTAAPRLVHPGAIYRHQGRSYRVRHLDLTRGTAELEALNPPYDTEPILQTRLQPNGPPVAQRRLGDLCIGRGPVVVGEQVVGYRRVVGSPPRVLDEIPLDLPEQVLPTQAYWVSIGPALWDEVPAVAAGALQRPDYGSTWPKARAQALARDDHRCQVCGATQDLHVHHLRPVRLFTSPADAHRPDNLITLCARCHQRAERHVWVRSALAGLAYLLRRLAALYVMSDPTDFGARVVLTWHEAAPTLVLYERVPGGIGFTEALFAGHEDLWRMAYERVRTCPCRDGCPACVGPGGPQGRGPKAEVLHLLTRLAAQHPQSTA